MKYSVALKNLSFLPEERQVIYVEDKFDKHINAIIKANYDQLKWTFKRSGLEFVYLPMFFNDEETKEKVLYYAPYLTSEIMEKAELRSSYILEFMSHQENREKISPSFLFAPQKNDDDWVFQGQTIELDTEDTNEIIQWIEDVIFEINEELDSARPRRCIRYDEDIEENDSAMLDADLDASSPVEFSSTPDLSYRFKSWLKVFGRKCVEEEDDYAETPEQSSSPSLDEILDEDVRETLEELEKKIDRLRLLGIPLSVIVEFVAKYETISRLRITDDNRIFLPEYGNREVQMGPLYKAVFFLFINHPEGIVLKRLEEHHRELSNYYRRTSNKKELTPEMTARINHLEYPGNDNINVVLSRINKCFRITIDEHLAKHYYIVGRPGEPYKIALDKIEIEWED